jgi:hypothetical protein
MTLFAGHFWRSFGARWGVSMVIESGESVKPASGARTWRSFAAKCVLDSITEFCFVYIAAGENVVAKGVSLAKGTFSANE